jgi:hypothetical protein
MCERCKELSRMSDCELGRHCADIGIEALNGNEGDEDYFKEMSCCLVTIGIRMQNAAGKSRRA